MQYELPIGVMELGAEGKHEELSITGRIVREVAEREGVEPVELTPPLFEAVDPDAVLALVVDTETGEPRDDVRIQFTYLGYEITVEGTDGHTS